MVTGERVGRASMVDEVSDRLRALLLSGEIRPGQRLRLRDLEERFGISHIPIREALRRLESEGLVVNEPQRGAVAAEMLIGELAEVYDARRLLEPVVVERAAAAYTDADREELAAVAKRLDEAWAAQDLEAFYKGHRDFHRKLLEPGLNKILEQILQQLWQRSERFVRLSVSAFPSDVEVAHSQHRSLLELCLAGKAGDVRKLLTDHLHVTEDAIRQRYQGAPTR